MSLKVTDCFCEVEEAPERIILAIQSTCEQCGKLHHAIITLPGDVDDVAIEDIGWFNESPSPSSGSFLQTGSCFSGTIRGDRDQELNMATQTQPQHITDLTVPELQALIAREVQHQLLAQRAVQQRDPETLQKARRHLQTHRWTPHPGSPSVAELVRKERDR